MIIKFIICLISLISLVNGSALVASSVKRGSVAMKRMLENPVHRSKRDILSELPSIIQCSANCVIPLIMSIVQDSMSGSRPMNPANFGQNQMTAQEMETYCRVYRNASTCTEACPSQSFKDTVREASAVPKFICTDRLQDFQRHLPCINQVGAETDDRCAAQCARYDNMETYIMSQINQTQRQFAQSRANGGNPLDDFFGEMLKQSCQYSACFLECQKQMITSRCGADAQRLVQDLIVVSLKSMDNLGSAVGLPTELPAECIQLQSGRENGTMTNFTQPGPFPNNQQNVNGQNFNNQNQNMNNQNQNFNNQNQNQNQMFQNQQNQGYPQNQNQGFFNSNQQYQQQQQAQQYQGMNTQPGGGRQTG